MNRPIDSVRAVSLIAAGKRAILPSAAFGLSWLSGNCVAANLVSNGDFANLGAVFVENVSLGADDLLTPGGSNVPGWSNVTPPGAPGKYANEMWIQPNNGFGVTASPGNGGGYFIDLTGEANKKAYGGLEQKVATTSGMGYTLRFALGALSPATANDWATETLTFIADNVTLVSRLLTTTGDLSVSTSTASGTPVSLTAIIKKAEGARSCR